MTALGDMAGPRAEILIVDDERHNRQLLEVMLAPEGVRISSASGGEEALAIVAQQPPDLILLDVMMPNMSGYQVAQALKANPATKGIPIIMVTAMNDREARMLGLNAGAEDFLTKPVDRAELCARVRNLLRLKTYGEGDARASALIESERLHRSIFDAAPVGLALVGLDGRWLRVNPRACEILGYSSDELQSDAARKLAVMGEVAGEAEALRRLVEGTLDRHVIGEKAYVHRDGSVVWARVEIAVHRGAEGGPDHFIRVLEDITERRVSDRVPESAAGDP